MSGFTQAHLILFQPFWMVLIDSNIQVNGDTGRIFFLDLKQSVSGISLHFSVPSTTVFSLPVSNTLSSILPAACFYHLSFLFVLSCSLWLSYPRLLFHHPCSQKKDEFLFPSGSESLFMILFFTLHSSESFPVNQSLHRHVILCRTKPREEKERNINDKPQ